MTRTPWSGFWRASADGDEPAVSNGHRVGDGVGRVHGVNLAVDQHECDFFADRRGGLGGKGKGRRSGQSGGGCEKTAS